MILQVNSAQIYTYDTYFLDILRQSHDMYSTFIGVLKCCEKVFQNTT
jgi:hypothetical protein